MKSQKLIPFALASALMLSPLSPVVQPIFAGDITLNDQISTDRQTIAHALSVLTNSQENPRITSATDPSLLTDIDQSPYKSAILWSVNQNIMVGLGEGTFKPQDPLTREQFAVILKAFATYFGDSTQVSGDSISNFSDKEEISLWAVDAVKWCVEREYMNGYQNKLNPIGTVTRAEVATMIYQLFESYLVS